ncbi:hypothetical protein [Streptomyces syringium]|uniref:hypothetical protein n=1 Tax=Streptomyces syringium TaxID=76729 RepID=UPI003AAAD817
MTTPVPPHHPTPNPIRRRTPAGTANGPDRPAPPLPPAALQFQHTHGNPAAWAPEDWKTYAALGGVA